MFENCYDIEPILLYCDDIAVARIVIYCGSTISIVRVQVYDSRCTGRYNLYRTVLPYYCSSSIMSTIIASSSHLRANRILS